MCDGYTAPPDKASADESRPKPIVIKGFKNTFCPLPSPSPSPKRQTFQSARDVQALQHFRQSTIPLLANYHLNGDNWLGLIDRLIEADPAIKHGALAIAFAHMEFALDCPAEPWPNPPDSQASGTSYRLSFQHYNTAIHLFRQYLNSDFNPDRTIVSVVFLLFIVFEIFQGRRDETLLHFKQALSFMRTQPRPSNAVDVDLLWTLSRLSLMTCLGNPSCDEPYPDLLETRFDLSYDPGLEAHSWLVNISNAALNLTRAIENRIYNDWSEIIQRQTELDEELSRWYDSVLKDVTWPSMSSAFDVRQVFMIMQYELTYIFVQCCVTGRQTSFDDHLARFDMILKLSRMLLDYAGMKLDISHTPILPLGPGFIPMLWLTAIYCRHRSLRRDAVELLRRGPDREGFWVAKEAVQGSQCAIEYEERGLEPFAADNPNDCGPESVREDKRISHVFLVYDTSERDAQIYLNVKVKSDDDPGSFKFERVVLDKDR